MFVDTYTNRAALYANKGEFDLAAEDYGKVISPDGFSPGLLRTSDGQLGEEKASTAKR